MENPQDTGANRYIQSIVDGIQVIII